MKTAFVLIVVAAFVAVSYQLEIDETKLEAIRSLVDSLDTERRRMSNSNNNNEFSNNNENKDIENSRVG
ncbi:hypothetical protein HOLleu_00295 [Holothuria leucospilota]|uniref:Uncharacterized protein n=1 Tax=Holothuria leucospilota TaxID=206669 RepID=A0A9Q1HJK6_HOLLE|nr:hypothetical protein HOLleu_00295 [Holothuria leucospilota]